MTALSILSETNDGATIVRMIGWAGLESQAELERGVTRLSAVAHGLLLLDLTQLEGMSSLAVGQIVVLQRAVAKRGGTMRVAGASANVRDVLVRCRIDALIPLFASVEEAMAASAPG